MVQPQHIADCSPLTLHHLLPLTLHHITARSLARTALIRSHGVLMPVVLSPMRDAHSYDCTTNSSMSSWVTKSLSTFPIAGSRSIDIGLSVSSKPKQGAHFEMLRMVRMVRHYSSKEFVPGPHMRWLPAGTDVLVTVIKIEPRINKFVL